MKNIAIVSPELVTGGAETMAVRLATSIDKSKYNVLFICLGKNEGSFLSATLEGNGVKTIYLNRSGESSKLKTLFGLDKVLNKFKPDVIHSHISGTIYSILWAFFHNVKIIHTVHTTPNLEFGKMLFFVMKRLVKRKKIVICAVSKENQLLASKCYKMPIEKIRYVNNPVEISKYEKVKRQDNFVNIINVGRQDTNKNQILLIEALKKLIVDCPNLSLTLVGDGNQHELLLTKSKEYELDNYITLTGNVDNPEYYLSQADIYVQTSHREGLPLSIIEAMATKLPIISSRVGGVIDLIDGNGDLYDDNDVDALCALVKKYYYNPQLRIDCGEQSFKLVQKFDAKHCADEYQNIYEEFSRK